VSQKAVEGGGTLAVGLRFITLARKRAPQRPNWHTGGRSIPEGRLERSFTQTELPASRQGVQFFVVRRVTGNGHDSRHGGVAVPDQNFLTGSDFVQILAEAILQGGDVDALHDVAIIATFR